MVLHNHEPECAVTCSYSIPIVARFSRKFVRFHALTTMNSKTMINYNQNIFQAFGIVVTFVLLSVLWTQTRKFYRLANKIPGPRAWPIIGNLFDAVSINFDAIKLLNLLSKYHGDDGMVRFWTGFDLMVSISHPKDVEIFFNSKSLLDRSDLYKPLENWFGKGNILTSNGELWKKARRMLIQTFHVIHPEALLRAVNCECDKLVEKFKNHHNYFPALSVLRDHNNCITTKVALDEDLQSNSDISKALELAEQLLKISVLRLISPLHYLSITFSLTKEGREFNRLKEDLKQTMKTVVQRKKIDLENHIQEGKDLPNSYIYNLLSKYDEEKIDDLAVHLLTLYLTSGDTTTGTMGFALLMIAIHPDVQDRVFEEDLEIQKWLDGRNLKPSDLSRYEFLEMVIKESLRLYPVAPLVGRVANEDVQFGKYLIPKGTNVCSIAMWTNRREDLHKNSLNFNPDRFSPTNTHDQHPYTFSPFGGGPKKCAGNTFAMMTMKLTLATLVRNYKLYSVYKNTEEVDANLFWAFTLKDKGNFQIKMKKRQI